jgi:hypothetical protein
LPVLVEVFTSQPLEASPSQLAYGVTHEATLQVPPAHVGLAFGSVQGWPQPPQFVSVVRLVSQPSEYWPLQSAKPGVQDAILHCPDTHDPLPFVTTHATPQAPQLFAFVVRSVSQPSATWPLQSPAPGAQLAMPHTPPVQLGVPPDVEHLFPQPLQLFTLVAVLTSQPLAALASQSANPVVHWMEHWPPEQLGVPFTVLHACPQPPQFCALVFRLTSQPLAAVPSQSA